MVWKILQLLVAVASNKTDSYSCYPTPSINTEYSNHFSSYLSAFTLACRCLQRKRKHPICLSHLFEGVGFHLGRCSVIDFQFWDSGTGCCFAFGSFVTSVHCSNLWTTDNCYLSLTELAFVGTFTCKIDQGFWKVLRGSSQRLGVESQGRLEKGSCFGWWVLLEERCRLFASACQSVGHYLGSANFAVGQDTTVSG